MTKDNQAPRSRRRWKIAIGILVGVLALFGGVGGAALYQSNTNPEFCATCHVMKPNVESYLTSNHLDNVHYRAGVQCKDCHDVTLGEEIQFGIDAVTGNYQILEDGTLPKREFDDEFCTKCHISKEWVALGTDWLGSWNPHTDSMGTFSCQTCHISHGEQINLCATCHANRSAQRMIENRDTPHKIR